MACDICGKTGTPLADLMESYQTDEIKAICPACEKVVNDQKNKLQKWTGTLLSRLVKKFMHARRCERGCK